MIAVDTNILIYAHRTNSPFHAPAVGRLTELAQAQAAWAIPWPCLHEFLGIVTNRKIYRPPTGLDVAMDYVENLLKSPSLVLLSETDAHWRTLQLLVSQSQATGGRVHDARIAAICLEHRVNEMWSADRDFNRFPALRVINPLIR